ncbi:cyclin-P3-1 [Prosopis cineraria]|uniref:cyclin-P3-1 n=1 Tax=Prosopis cineraria TaxID=364024 RepID=UPI00240FE5AD|nr:cyclin-P3-1 [Prosopis cineraria]XP_054803807.1 cyclin-P3-1 [Prosopis cineraria]XP_054803809.1 cyclin-P3-1 [Prosopis cineraria]XP_054803810.1 cyclin-P3-1 [Prosopis cineraria]XP_054803811.1 cyclin-P3-1 [Prosopis cineraria]
MATKPEAYKSLELDASESSCSSNAPRVLMKLSCVLERSIQRNEKHRRSAKRRDPVTMFDGTKAPNMSVRQYMERIYKYSGCSTCCFVIAQIYMDRYFQRKGGYLTSFNVHRLLITSVMVAAKFVDDGCYSNGHYARVGGVSTAEMNRMELEFLFNLDFRLFVTTQVFCKYCEKLDQVTVQEFQTRHSTIGRRGEK